MPMCRGLAGLPPPWAAFHFQQARFVPGAFSFSKNIVSQDGLGIQKRQRGINPNVLKKPLNLSV